MLRKTHVLLFAVLILLSCNSGSHTFKYNLGNTKDFIYKVNLKQALDMGMDVKLNVESNIAFSVLDSNKTGYNLQFEMEKISINGKQPDYGKIAQSSADSTMSDSLNAVENKIQKQFANILHVPINGHLTPLGKLEYKLPEKLKKSMQNLQISVNQFFIFIISYPKNTISVGDSWKVEEEFKLFNSGLKKNVTYTLKDINDKTATIAMKAKFPEQKVNMTLFSLKVSGKQEGQFHIDLKTGLVQQVNLTNKLTGSPEGSNKFTITLKGTFSATLL